MYQHSVLTLRNRIEDSRDETAARYDVRCGISFRLFSFGAGRRACPGEVLAKNRLFLIITSLFQAFRFLPTQGKMAPNHDPRTFLFAITCQIKDYEVIAKPRKVGEHAH